MSGAIFTPLEGPGALDGTSGHPLVCPLCHAQYERPCLLDCFHEFCAGCLRGRAADGRLACPLCQHQTVVKGPSGLPPVDRLLQFLVDSSGDGTEVVRCANCDLECGKQDAETTYFCNTCGQPLCARCRDETHRARMFARHDIVALGQRSRDVLQKCTLHAEPYVLFSTDKKSLLCIRCFRDMQGWVEGAGGEELASVPERGSRAGSLQGEPRPLRGPRVSLRPGLRAAAAGGAGGEGPAIRHARGHRAAAGDGGGGATQRGRGGGRHPGPLQQHAGQTVREESAAAAGRAEVSGGRVSTLCPLTSRYQLEPRPAPSHPQSKTSRCPPRRGDSRVAQGRGDREGRTKRGEMEALSSEAPPRWGWAALPLEMRLPAPPPASMKRRTRPSRSSSPIWPLCCPPCRFTWSSALPSSAWPTRPSSWTWATS